MAGRKDRRVSPRPKRTCMKTTKTPADIKLDAARLKLRRTRALLKRCVLLLIRFQRDHRYRQPNSDHLEYCKGCNRNPHSVPQHHEDCIVVDLQKVLDDLKGKT